MPNHQLEKEFNQKEAMPEKEISMAEGLEIEKLKERIEKMESQLKKEGALEEKEKMIKWEIKEHLQDLQRTPSFAAPPATRDETEEIEKFPPSQQVGALISLVFDKGLPKAISVAKALKNPAILDEFHDTLVDRYYQELVKKEIIKPS